MLAAVRRWMPLPDDDVLIVRANGAVQAGAGALLATGIQPRLSALAMAGSLVPTTIAALRAVTPARRVGELVLPYTAVRTADADAVLLEFLQRTYEAAADAAGRDRARLERCLPPRGEFGELRDTLKPRRTPRGRR